MVKEQSLGRLQRIELRTIWTSEPAHFTPWLARAENLEVLGETLGLEFELEATEKEVGPFRADLVCKDIGTGNTVLIENQIEQTDHDHLGKLLTYAAGLQAVTVVWLAASFRDEHRAALDWLNEITHEESRFFGLEIELWRIGESPAAPKFNIVCMPNDWSRSVAQAARVIDDDELSERKLKQRRYWNGFHEELNAAAGPVRGNRKAQPQHWMTYGVGAGGFQLVAAINIGSKFIRAELYISGENANKFLGHLEDQKEEIERELGYRLEWGDQLPTARDRRISRYYREVDPADESDWPDQHRWMAQSLNDMHRVFAQRVREL